MLDGSGESAIVLETRWIPRALIVFNFTWSVFVTIDQVTSTVPSWGKHVFRVEPGEHEVRASLGRGLRKEWAETEATVEIAQGAVVHLRYYLPGSAIGQGQVRGGRLEIIDA